MAWSDLASLAQDATTAVLGQSVTYTPDGGAAESVTGIFDAAAEMVRLQNGVEVQDVQPVVSFDISDLTQDPVAGDTVTVGAVVYTIEKVLFDGSGGCDCLLNE